MDRNMLSRVLPFIVVLFFIIGWTVLLYFYNPEEIVGLLGVHNSYVMAFLISMFGAFSSFTTFSTYPAVITLAAGKINPYFLGVAAGIGLSIGDILFFYFGVTVRGVVSETFKERLQKILKRLKNKPDYIIQAFVFLYVGFTPFPNNVLTGSLALIAYPFKKVALPLILGDLVLPTLAAVLAYYGADFFGIGLND